MNKKDDKKRKKRKEAAKNRRLKHREKVDSFFHLRGSFPLDMGQEICRCINKDKMPNKKWKANCDNLYWILHRIDEVLRLSVNQEAFSKYFPRITIGWHIEDSRCVMFPYQTKRVFLNGDNQDYYLFDESAKIPLCGGRKVIFTKHAFERLTTRYAEESMDKGFEMVPSVMALHYPIIVRLFDEVDFETTMIDDDVYLHSFGRWDANREAHFGRGHFPILYKDEYAVAKTFLYDEWLGSTVTN